MEPRLAATGDSVSVTGVDGSWLLTVASHPSRTGRVTRFDEPQSDHIGQASVVNPNLDSSSGGLPHPFTRTELVRPQRFVVARFVHD